MSSLSTDRATALEDFGMWAMLQDRGQHANISALKSLVHDWITLSTQKTAGQRVDNRKGIPWEPGSKAVSWDNLERIKMGILCEAVALVLSGKLDEILDEEELE